MTGVTLQTQNWATFTTIFDPDNGEGNDQKFAFATWAAQQNNRYGYVCVDHDPVPASQNPAPASLGQRIKAAKPVGHQPQLGAVRSEHRRVHVRLPGFARLHARRRQDHREIPQASRAFCRA